MPTFQNREQALNQICGQTNGAVLLNIYGEAGIGKSYLLQEAARRMRAKSPPALVTQADLGSLAKTSTNRPEAAIRALIGQSEGRLSVVWQNPEQAAGQVVAELIDLADHMQVILMFDTTEVLQEDMEFWHWMEANLIGPLVVEGRLRQVFAGRVPVPWRRVEVRRALKLLQLPPLSAEDAARNLVREVLHQENPDLEDDESVERAIDLVLELSFGHPLLSERLAAYVASHWSVSTSASTFRPRLCQQVVKPFVDEQFLKDVRSPWGELLWWISVLDWFDATILQRYLGRVDPELVEGRMDYFFIQGITRLRIQNTVVWREERGDRLHGVIGDIMRRCFEVTDWEKCRRACQAAAETFEAMADEFPAESPEAQRYRQDAETYRLRAKQEV
jgi:hypothetical protein